MRPYRPIRRRQAGSGHPAGARGKGGGGPGSDVGASPDGGARAILASAQRRRLVLPEVQGFESVIEVGGARHRGRSRVLVGQPGFLTDAGIDLTALAGRIDQQQAAAHTAIVVAVDQAAVGAIALGDELRPDPADAVIGMRRAGLEPVLVTGDNERAARRVANQLGITAVHAGVRPEGKAEIVRELQVYHTRVAMVGDGINDTAALMQADVGIAAGGGTDIAVESADVVLLRTEVAAILDAATSVPERSAAPRSTSRSRSPSRHRCPAGHHRLGLPRVGDGRDGRLRHRHLHQLARHAALAAGTARTVHPARNPWCARRSCRPWRHRAHGDAYAGRDLVSFVVGHLWFGLGAETLYALLHADLPPTVAL